MQEDLSKKGKFGRVRELVTVETEETTATIASTRLTVTAETNHCYVRHH